MISGHQLKHNTQSLEEILKQNIAKITKGHNTFLCQFLFALKKHNHFHFCGYYSRLSIFPKFRNILIGLYAKSEAYFYLHTKHSVLDRGFVVSRQKDLQNIPHSVLQHHYPNQNILFQQRIYFIVKKIFNIKITVSASLGINLSIEHP